jgi:dihydroorotate dehydrogenase (NAD+) catalytic subunit
VSTEPDLRVALGPLRLSNPVLTASGTCGYGEELTPFFDLAKIGGVVCKSVSLRPRAGNPPSRLAETPAGMLNSIGLQNVGVEAFISEKLPSLRRRNTAVIASIFGVEIEEFGELASRLDGQEGISGLEVNVSCPNTSSGGVEFGVVPESTRRVTEAVRTRTGLPVIVKLSPNVTDITEIARAAMDGGAHILSLVNTFFGMAIDIHSRRPVLSSGTGGLSGPAIRPMAVHQVRKVARAVEAPLIGIGGISTAHDALEFILAGASAVQVGTAIFVDPKAPLKVAQGIADYCRRMKVTSLSELIGAVDDGGEGPCESSR